MIHQKRFAHLEYDPGFNVGDKIKRGMKVGRMGNSGKSTWNHVHGDIIQAENLLKLIEINEKGVYRLADIPKYMLDLPEVMLQYSYFLDGELFGFPKDVKLPKGVKSPVVITSYFGDPLYMNRGVFEFHPAYDYVPYNRHTHPGDNFDIFWNRSPDGTVTVCGWDNAYGWHICIAY